MPVSGFMALLQLWSMLLSMAPDTAEGREDRAVQSWPCPSLSATLEELVLPPHQLQHSGEQVLHLTWAAH